MQINGNADAEWDGFGSATIVFEEEAPVLSPLFSALSYAAVSLCEYHSVLLIRSDGTVADDRVFDRRSTGE